MGSEHKCSATVYDRSRPRFQRSRPCEHDGKVCVDGKWYCNTHDPAKVQARREESMRAYIAKRDAEQAVRDRHRACIAAMEGIDDPVAFMQQVRYFVGRVYSMRSHWAESSEEKKQELWHAVHSECATTFEMMTTSARQEDANEPQEPDTTRQARGVSP